MEEGTTILHYKILAKLGEGGMGVVYKAQDTKLDRTVALKFLPPSVAQTDEDRQRFLREAKAAAALNHPNICTIFNVEDHDGQQFISMEFIDGQTLQNLLESRSPDLRTSLEFALQIAEALAKAHSGGIIHRDIKPSNIMINEDGRIKVMDFGLARMKDSEELTQAGTTVGTLDYMSPEQVRSEAVDHRSDIFSFGVVLYEMLTGTKPFRGEHKAATLYSIANEEPTPLSERLPNRPQKLSDLVNRMLEKDPTNRYSSADEAAADLEACLNELSGTEQSAPEKTEQTKNPAQPPLSRADQKQDSSGSTSITINLPALNTRSGMASLATGILLLILIGYWLVPFFGSSTIPQDNTIAVLPLENMSQDPADTDFTNGVHVELINRLAGIGDLTVIARSSVLGYSPGERDLQAIGEELGVSSVIEGTVQRAGDQLRVTVQLTDTDNLGTLWSQSYEENIDNVFEIQSRIAREVAGELQASLTEEEQERLKERPTRNSEAYNFYMQGLDYLNRTKFEIENSNTATLLFRRAIDEDPEFAHAWAMLAVAYSNLYWLHEHTPERLDQVRKTAERAQMLSPDLPETHLAIGLYRYWSEPKNNKQNLSYFESALEQFPNHSFLHVFMGLTHRRLGNWDQVERHLNKAIELDPRNSNHYQELSYFYYLSREYNKANSLLNRFIDLAPDALVYPWVMKAWIDLEMSGTLDGYEIWREQIHPENPANIAPYYWGQYLYLSRNWEEAFNLFLNLNRNIAIEYEHTYKHRLYMVAKLLEAQGNQSEAMAYYNQVRDTVETLVDRYPNDPRYHAALGKIYARMNEPDKAFLEGQKAVELMPISQNAYDGAWFEYHLAEIYAWTGRKEQAIEILEYLLTVPSHAFQNWLRINPDWDPLHDHPRFQNLVGENQKTSEGTL